MFVHASRQWDVVSNRSMTPAADQQDKRGRKTIKICCFYTLYVVLLSPNVQPGASLQVFVVLSMALLHLQLCSVAMPQLGCCASALSCIQVPSKTAPGLCCFSLE